MKVSATGVAEARHASDALVLPLFEGEGAGPYKDLDAAMGGLISSCVKSGEFKGKRNEVSVLRAQGGLAARRVALLGLGKKEEFSAERLRQAGGSAASHLAKLGLKDMALSTRNIQGPGLSPAHFAEGALISLYRFGRYKSEGEKPSLAKLTVLSGDKLGPALRWAEALARAVHFAMDLVNSPSNDMTPSALARAAGSIKGVSVRVINREEAKRLGMGAYLSVARGSAEPPKFIVATYRGPAGRGAGKRPAGPQVALVGKSITFDSGGISLKPSEGMEKMKYDMAGGAAVLGALMAASEERLPVHAVGILPAAENLPGGTASKPGDIVRAIGGKTIEIVNTDAEGRLALADAIGYAIRLKPGAIIDIATLTGACSVALGNEAMALMGNDEALIGKVEAASAESAERVWRMPLFEEYGEYIESDVADLKNSGGKSGSLVTAGYFLKEFASGVPWVHLDIASTAWTDKAKPYLPKGATGAGVRLLASLLRSMGEA
ncbi:MAG: leucyl aminopeptidase [Thermodesulfovibrionales bacterium]